MVRPTNPTSRSFDRRQLTRLCRTGPPRLEASLGALDTKINNINGGMVCGEACTYLQQYNALSKSTKQQSVPHKQVFTPESTPIFGDAVQKILRGGCDY
jgi:hypothetical protein